jgi:hypothetical protein
MNHKKRILFIFFFFLFTLSRGGIVINELMVRNVSYLLNDDYSYEGWIELFNSGSQTEILSSYYLSDDENSFKWRIDSDDLLPGEYRLIFFDELDKENHANFKLKPEGGTILLFGSDGNREDRLTYPEQFRNISYGKETVNSINFGYFLNPTPGRENISGHIVYGRAQVDTPAFSVPAGFYSNSFQVEIFTSTPGAEIYYTLDGTEPEKGKSIVYTGPVQIDQNTPLRAIAVSENLLPSEISTVSYFVNSGSNSLPVVSLVTDPKMLYDDEIGILVVGTNGLEVPYYCLGDLHGFYANYWRDWDRPCNFEYFDTDKQQQLNQEVKIGNFGNCSRVRFVKSIKVNPTKIHGGTADGNKLNYAIFKEKPNLKWKSIVLRNSGNDMGHSFLRDGFMQTLLIGQMDIDHQAYEPAVVFVNGKYYGLLNIRERTNEDFLYSNYGLEEDQFYMVEGAWGNGTVPDYQDLITLSYRGNLNTSSVYEQLDASVDIDEFLNYFMSQIYFANTDWPGWNIKSWKRKENGKWRWILYDTDFGYSLYSNTYKLNTFPNAEENHRFFLFIRGNNRLKERFITKNIIHLGSTFAPDRVIGILDSIKNYIAPDALVFEEYLKGHSKMDSWSWWQRSWSDVIDITMKTFARERPSYMFAHMKEYFRLGDFSDIRIYSDVAGTRFMINEEIANTSDLKSKYYARMSLKIVPVVPQGYKFKEWQIRKGQQPAVISSQLVYEGIFEGGEPVSFYAVIEKDPEWERPFLPQIYLNEICVTNSQFVDEYFESDDWIEIYNAGDIPVDLAGMYISDNSNDLRKYQIPATNAEKTTVLPNDYLIIWADGQPWQGPLHVDFSLSATSAETISVSKVIDGELYVIDFVTYDLHKKGETFARFSYDFEGDWRKTFWPTFAAPNLYTLPVDLPYIFAGDNIAQLYPNPVSETLWFSLKDENVTARITITDYTGKILMEKKIQHGEGVDVNALPQGLYMAIIEIGNNRQIGKFIKR